MSKPESNPLPPGQGKQVAVTARLDILIEQGKQSLVKLDQIVKNTTPKRQFVVGPIQLITRRKHMNIELGPIEYDKNSGFFLPIVADGPTTGDLSAVDASGLLATSYAATTGKLKVEGIPESPGDYTINVSQPVDNPNTPEVETITATIHFTTVHSMASGFNVGGAELIPRV